MPTGAPLAYREHRGLTDNFISDNEERREMVEAVGVEPTSESTDTRESTCVSALESSPVTLKRRPNRY